MKKLIILLLILLVSQSLYSKEKNDLKILFDKGTVELAHGNYNKSLDIFNILEEQEVVSPQLFYNMGINFFQLKKYGMSRLCFEKAKFLMPTDSDVVYNLNIVKKVIDNTLPQEFKISTGVKGWSDWYGKFKINKVVIISTVLFLFLLVTIGVFIIFFDVKWGVISFLVFIFWFVSLIFLWDKINYDVSKFVIVIDETSLYSSPDMESKVVMDIPEGVKSVVVDEKIDWYKIKMKNGVAGWVIMKKTKKIVPRYFWNAPSVVLKILSIGND